MQHVDLIHYLYTLTSTSIINRILVDISLIKKFKKMHSNPTEEQSLREIIKFTTVITLFIWVIL